MTRSRTNIEIDDGYVQTVMDRYGVHTKTEEVDLALRHLAGQPMTRDEALAMRGAYALEDIGDRQRSAARGVILADTSAWVEFDRATGSTVDVRLTQPIVDDGSSAVTSIVGIGLDAASHRARPMTLVERAAIALGRAVGESMWSIVTRLRRRASTSS